ncbi:kinase-like protein [Ramaria rubella]|nr:kinase-like protein [Ramaria rubella]
MEYMPHSDFFDILSILCEGSRNAGSRRPLHTSVAKWYVTDILIRLKEIHDCGYYHGDVKPENLMMRPDGHVVLADFGETKKDIPENWKCCNHVIYGTPEEVCNNAWGFLENDHWPVISPSDPEFMEKCQATSFLRGLLVFEPWRRMTWDQIFAHGWLLSCRRDVENKLREAPLSINILNSKWAVGRSWKEVIEI